MRQAQLGASYKVLCLSSRAGSPYRAKPNQQPVPSVARSAESTVKLVNKGREAYTGNIAGRRGDVPPQSNSASLGAGKQLATVLTCRKPVQRDRFGETPEGLPGSESVACSERSIRNLGGPSTSSNLPIGGRTVQRKKTVRWVIKRRESDHLIVL